MADGRQSQGAGKGEGVRDCHLPSLPCSFLGFMHSLLFPVSRREVLREYLLFYLRLYISTHCIFLSKHT